MTIRPIVCGLVAALAICSPSSKLVASHEPSSRQSTLDTMREYIDVSGYLTSDAEIDAWYTLVAGLGQNFGDICGDTFCEGEYSNIESLRYRCSVERTTGTIGSCVWVFAASNEEIHPRTGKVIVDVQAWRCRIPLLRGTSIHDFLKALAGAEPLYAPLPGTSTSLYDTLMTCL